MINWKRLTEHIPFSVTINNKVNYEILYVDDFKDGNTLGETRFAPRQIVIKKNLKPKLTVITFLHELAHAFSNEHNVDLTETQILALEKCFYYILKDNNIFKESGIGKRNEKRRNCKRIRRTRKKAR